jgi:hypothetical protein
VLSDAQKTVIRRHLGYHSAAEANYPFIDTFWSVTRILETLPAATESEVISILDRLATIEASLSSATNLRLQASSVGGIKLNPDEIDRLWTEIKRWRRELSALLGLPRLNAGGIMVV